MDFLRRYSFILAITLFSCGGPSDITSEIEGKYRFKYPTGQIEILVIKNDYTYGKEIYSSEEEYLKNKTLYKNNGTWSYRGTELGFDNWLVYCEFRNPNKILDKPSPSTMLNVLWYAPTDKHVGLIDVYSENGYVFEKFEDK